MSSDRITAAFSAWVGVISSNPSIKTVIFPLCGPYSDSVHAGRYGDRIPVEGEIFLTRRDMPWGPPSLFIKCVPGVFPGGKAAGAWRYVPTPSNVEVKERVELYL
jgi:hypothetical protein